MKTTKQLFIAVALIFVLAIGLSRIAAAPLGSSFTYQGRLKSEGTPANGLYDVCFRLCDAAANGNQVAQPITNTVAVSNGLFTATLDFGPGLYADKALWLWISIRTNGGGNFTDLTPRQPLTPTPFALYASNAGTAAAALTAATATTANAVAPGSVGADGLAVGAVDSNRIADGTIAAADLANGAVTAAKIAAVSNWSTLKITKPGAAGWEEFGRAVTTIGTNLILVGAPRDNIGADQAGAAHLFASSGRLVTTFTNPTPAMNDFFGTSVSAVETRFVLVGAPGDDAGATNAGRAYLFNTNGTLLTTFVCPGPTPNGAFGQAVAALGSDRVVIGSPGKTVDDYDATNYGMAFLFRTNGALLASFTNPIFGDTGEFGGHVAVVGNDRVLICAEGYYWGRGAVYMFNTNGILLHTFMDPTPVYSELFGYSVAAVGNDRIFVGALYAEEGGYETGAAFLFGVNGALLTTITNPTPVYNDWFGCSVAAAGTDRLVVGALQDNTAGPGAGAAYVFGTNGNLITTITHTPVTGGWFGDAVAALGPERVVVATYADNAIAPWAGAVYVCASQSAFTPGLIADGVSDNSITTSDIANGAVTADKIAAEAVGNAELGSDAASLIKVSGGKISVDSGRLNLNDSLYLNDRDIYFRGDSFHGLGWYGSGKLFEGANVNGPALYGNSGGVLGWRNGSVDHIVLAWNDSGRVGIGTNNPAVRLDVNGTNDVASTTDGIVNIGASSARHLTFDNDEVQGRNGSGTSALYLNRNGGNVGIGTGSTGAKLDVNGDTRIRGVLRLGPETYPLEAPNPAGLVVRRINSVAQTAGNVLARSRTQDDTGDITIERDGTAGGFVIKYPANPGYLTIACMGMDASGTSRNFYTTIPGPTTAGSVQIYTNTLNIVHFECTFGITYNAGEHLTQVTLSRFGSDNFWSGTLTSTYAQ